MSISGVYHTQVCKLALSSQMTISEGSTEQMVAMLKLEHQKEKSLLRAELTEEKRGLEERLNSEKRTAIDELDQRYRDESMKMMESQVDFLTKNIAHLA